MATVKTRKASAARRRLEAIVERRAKVESDRRGLEERFAALARERDEVAEQLSASIAAESLTDGTPANPEQAKLATKLAKMDADLTGTRWAAEREGFRRALAKLNQQAEAACLEGFDELARELLDKAGEVDEAVDVAVRAIDRARAQWDGLAAAWMELERGAGLTPRGVRLDLPHFPLPAIDAEPPSAVPAQLAYALAHVNGTEPEPPAPDEPRRALAPAGFIGDAENEGDA